LRNAHRIALKGESLRKQRLPDESAHPLPTSMNAWLPTAMRYVT